MSSATAHELMTAANRLLDDPARETEGIWPRAAAILARQALETALREQLSEVAPGAHAAPFSTQLLLLREVLPDKDLAARVAYAWSALSDATHHHGYELPPSAESLRDWLAPIAELLISDETRGD